MGLIFSRVGSESYFSSLDKSLGKIKTDVDALKAGKTRRQKLWSTFNAQFTATFLAIYFCILAYAAWIAQQPTGTYTTTQHAKRMSLVFLAPALAYAFHSLLAWGKTLLDKKADKQIEVLQKRMRKTVTALKDSTHYEQTQKLLAAYDPDYKPPSVLTTPVTGGFNNQIGTTTTGGLGSNTQQKQQPLSMRRQATNAAMNLAANTVQGAGAQMSQFWSGLANTIIADDPVLLKMATDAKNQAELMQQDLMRAQYHIENLERESAELRERLGLTPVPSKQFQENDDQLTPSLIAAAVTKDEDPAPQIDHTSHNATDVAADIVDDANGPAISSSPKKQPVAVDDTEEEKTNELSTTIAAAVDEKKEEGSDDEPAREKKSSSDWETIDTEEFVQQEPALKVKRPTTRARRVQ